MSAVFSNKVALVTAAAAGIGAATAEVFAQRGAAVMLSDINQERGEAMLEKLRASGAKAAFLRADATNEDDIEKLVRTTVETFGGLHIAANIVGDAHPQSAGPELHKNTLEGWEATNAVSLRSVFLSLKHEISHMLEHGGGTICNVTSLAGMLHVPESGAAYSAAKAGVIRLTKFAAIEYGNRGIRVNCIAPGTTPTDAYQKAGPEAAEQLIASLLKGHAIKRVIEPSEQAEAIAWLCSDAASMVTGQVLPVDGGWSAR